MVMKTTTSDAKSFFVRSKMYDGQQRVIGKLNDKFITLALTPPSTDRENWDFYVNNVKVLVYPSVPAYTGIRARLTATMGNELNERFSPSIIKIMLHDKLVDDIDYSLIENTDTVQLLALKDILKPNRRSKYSAL